MSRYRDLICQRALETFTRPGSERDVQSAARALEPFAGPNAYDGMIFSRSVMLAAKGLHLLLRDELRRLASARQPTPGTPAPPITVRLDGQRGGHIVLENQGTLPLHHCLIFTRLQTDVQRVRAEAAREDAVGGALPVLGVSREMAAASRQAARLRYLYEEQEKGWVIYVPEIGPGARVSAGFDGVVRLTLATGADLSLWCDEMTVEHQPAANWAEVKLEVEDRRNGVRPPSDATPQPPPPMLTPRIPRPRTMRPPSTNETAGPMGMAPGRGPRSAGPSGFRPGGPGRMRPGGPGPDSERRLRPGDSGPQGSGELGPAPGRHDRPGGFRRERPSERVSSPGSRNRPGGSARRRSTW